MDAEIKISLTGIGAILGKNSKLIVPTYQRSYAWEEKQVIDLFQDIETAITENEAKYFLGSIVIKRNNDASSEVVDGQQRLATISIFIAAVRNYYYKINQPKLVSQLADKYLSSPDMYEDNKEEQHLILNQNDNHFFYTNILQLPINGKFEEQPTKDSHKRLLRALEIAERQVCRIAQSSDNFKILLEWEKYIFLKVKVILVEVPDYSNAFTIFETLNDRGLDLAISDLLKNYLFNLAGDRLDEVLHKWTSMNSILELSDESVVQYIKYLWASLYGNITEKKLYEKIKETINNKRAAINFADNLEKNAKLYMAILYTENEYWKTLGESAKLHMATINLLGMVQIRPLLLAIMEKFAPIEIKKSLKDFTSMIVRLLISGNVSSGTFEKQFSDAAKLVRDGSIRNKKELFYQLKQIIPNDIAFRESFANATVSKSKLAKYYLRVLENEMQGKIDPEFIANPDDEKINLEHIMPKNPASGWTHISSDECEQYCNRIGNLTLIRTKINSSIGNSSFTLKLKMYKSDYRLTKSLTKYKKWGVEEIQKRQIELAEYAVKAWSIKY